MRIFPNRNIKKATTVTPAMTSDREKLSLKWRNPMHEEIIPPIPIWIKPNKAEALPAFFVNDESAIATAFG